MKKTHQVSYFGLVLYEYNFVVELGIAHAEFTIKSKIFIWPSTFQEGFRRT